MPPKTTNVVSYAAGASLAAVALIYVFGPTFTLDSETAAGGSKKKTAVGLRNQANDCFINSVLQVLAGLGDLRVYLIRETHRRGIESPGVYAHLVQPEAVDEQIPEWKLRGLQDGIVTQGLKEMLDALNERPIYKKSVSPFPFIRVLETSFRQRISRQQQDAQELLQIVAERLKDEYHAGRRVRLYVREHGVSGADQEVNEPSAEAANVNHAIPTVKLPPITMEMEESFPMEGKFESTLECLTCRYKSKPREETFCTLTLAVPQVSSTTLNECFDGIFKTEQIDDFKCENCRLLQAIENLQHGLSKSTSEAFREQAQESIARLREAVEIDPENPPEDIDLGDIRYAPKRKIAKTTRMTIFPKILAVHLSRSIYGPQVTSKNYAKVSFPEQLPLGGLADQRKYKLLGVVTHKGGHNSGHYEAFRRQNLAPPFANSNTFQPSEAYSKTPTRMSTPELLPRNAQSSVMSTPDLLSTSSKNSSTPSLESLAVPPRRGPSESRSSREIPTNGAKERESESGSLRSAAAVSTKSALSKVAHGKDRPASPKHVSPPSVKPVKKRKAGSDKWWRVNDDKVKEAKTSDVLGKQKEVYLLFYELEKEYDQ